jgi:phosphate transport system permease protein
MALADAPRYRTKMPPSGPSVLATRRSPRLRHRNTIVLVLSVSATVIGLGWLLMILGTPVYEGFSGLSIAVFTEMTPPPACSIRSWAV